MWVLPPQVRILRTRFFTVFVIFNQNETDATAEPTEPKYNLPLKRTLPQTETKYNQDLISSIFFIYLCQTFRRTPSDHANTAPKSSNPNPRPVPKGRPTRPLPRLGLPNPSLHLSRRFHLPLPLPPRTPRHVIRHRLNPLPIR